MAQTHHQPGGLIGPYEILDLLGSGGMGVVYKARDRRLNRNVAVKVLLPEVVADEAALARFEHEVRAVAALSHPNILAIYDFQRDGQSVYAVMELLTGGTLRDRLKSGPLPPRKAVEIGIQIARGLAAAHELSFVHRDLKPENVAFTRDGRVKILDFGLARQALASADSDGDMQTRPQHTLPGLILGTVGYMSPEQVRGQDVDHRSDLFAFGVLLYEMITGRRAFNGHTAADTMSAILNEDVKDFSESGVSIPPALDRVVRRCLEKHPGERFHSARDLAFALENATGSGWHSNHPPLESGARWPRAARAALLVSVGAVAGSLLAVFARTPQPPVVIRQLTHSTFDSAPSVMPDGTTVAFASTRTGVSQIYRRTLGSGTERPLMPQARGPARLPRYFDDASLVLFLRREGAQQDAWKYSTDTGLPDSRPVVSNVVEAVPSPDGRLIGFIQLTDGAPAHSERPLGIIGTASSSGDGEHQVLLQDLDMEFASLDWSPDGTRLAAVERALISPNGTAVVVVDVNSGRRLRFPAPTAAAYGALTWSDNEHLVVTEATTTQVYVPGSPGRVVLMDASEGSTDLLFWNNELFSVFGYLHGNARLDVVGEGRLAFDAVRIQQTLEERPLGSGSANVPRRPLTRGTSLDRQPTYSPVDDFVVFTSNRSGNLELWLVTSEGEEHQLTHEAVQDWDPGFAADGTLVWSSGEAGDRDIWKATIGFEADGRPVLERKTPISDDGDAQNPSVTRDGLVVYRGSQGDGLALWKVRIDGTGAEPLYGGGLIGIPDVSPDGRYVLFREDDRAHMKATIKVVEVATGRLDPFQIEVKYTLDESSADINRGRARWNGDDAIMFVGEGEGGAVGIYQVAFAPGRTDSGPWTLMVPSEPGRLTESFDISPDGRRIVVSFGTYERNIMIAEGVPGLHPARPGGR